MQVAPQQTQSPIPSSAYAVDPPSSSRRQYSPQTPQSTDPSWVPSTRTTTSPQSSRQPSKRPSGNAARPSNAETHQQASYQSSVGSYNSTSSTPRVQDMSAITHASPVASTNPTSSPYQQSQREQRSQQDVLEGPPIPPPPRTSSNQRSQNVVVPLVAPLSDRNAASRFDNTKDDERSPSSRNIAPRDVQKSGGRDSNPAVNQPSKVEQGRDTTATAGATSQSRRRGPASPEGPQRAISTREPAAQQSPHIQSRSTTYVASTASPIRAAGEDNQVTNRVVVTDPEIDLEREKERQAEAEPKPGLVGSGGADDGARGPGKSRQDHSLSASRRKETRFGEYVLGQTLGEGEFGKVKLGWKKDGSVQVAIKLIRRDSLGTNPSRLPKIYREISILGGLSHPNIVRLHEMIENERHIGIILEYASGGELFDFILNHRYLKDNAARRLFAQLVSGVGYLHKKGIVHRDLKLENLLLDRNRNIIITDFGFANTFDPRDELSDEIEYNLTNRDFVKRQDLERVHENGSRKGDLMQTSCGSPCYAAPELVVTDSLYTGRKVDVWSCGVILVRTSPVHY